MGKVVAFSDSRCIIGYGVSSNFGLLDPPHLELGLSGIKELNAW